MTMIATQVIRTVGNATEQWHESASLTGEVDILNYHDEKPPTAQTIFIIGPAIHMVDAFLGH